MELKSPDAHYREFWELFNAEQFFQAHEVLETLWRRTSGAERDFYQGLIQIAAVFVHVQKGTPEGGRKLLKKASAKLQKYGPLCGGVKIEDLLAQTGLVLESQVSFPKIEIKFSSL